VLELPEVVRNRALAEGADDWLAGLDALVGDLAGRWDFTVGTTHTDGTEAFVVDVELRDGTPAVLKLLVPRAVVGFDRSEATFLRLVGGDGCPELIHDDPACGALLMERLGPSMFRLGLPYEQRVPLLCDAASRIWRPAPDSGFPDGAQKAASLARAVAELWDELDRPCSEAAVEQALTAAGRREAAHDDERAVLVHGDVHQWNALRSRDGADFALVDPDGYLAEPELDLGVILREDPVELAAAADPFAVAARMAARCGVDATAVWEWALVERVSTGLLATKIGLQPPGRQMLATADALASR
jgi:streptomycin 6-kinase